MGGWLESDGATLSFSDIRKQLKIKTFLIFQTEPSDHLSDNQFSFTSFLIVFAHSWHVEIISQGTLNEHHALTLLCKTICKWNDYVTWNVFLSDILRGLV